MIQFRNKSSISEINGNETISASKETKGKGLHSQGNDIVRYKELKCLIYIEHEGFATSSLSAAAVEGSNIVCVQKLVNPCFETLI